MRRRCCCGGVGTLECGPCPIPDDFRDLYLTVRKDGVDQTMTLVRTEVQFYTWSGTFFGVDGITIDLGCDETSMLIQVDECVFDPFECTTDPFHVDFVMPDPADCLDVLMVLGGGVTGGWESMVLDD